MKDFEQLLNETLQEVCETEPPVGMEARIMARIGNEVEHVPRWCLLSAAVAAGLLVAVLFHQGIRAPTKPVTASHLVSPGVGNLTTHPFPSDEGATQSSLDRIPGDSTRQTETGLKVRDIGPAPTFGRRDQSSHPGMPRHTSLHIAPIEIAPLRMEPLELASLTLKNGIEKGDTP